MLQNLTLFSKSVTPGSKIEGDTLGNALGGGGGKVVERQQGSCFSQKHFLLF